MSLLLLLNPDNQRPTPRFVREAFRQDTDEVVVVLLTIAHAQLDPPARVCSDSVDLVSRGNTFIGGIPFEVSLPDEDPDSQARVTLRMSVIDRSLVAVIRNMAPGTPPVVTLEVVMVATPDIVESGPYEFTLRGVDGDIITLEAEIAYEDMLSEPFPSGSFSPASHPGLF